MCVVGDLVIARTRGAPLEPERGSTRALARRFHALRRDLDGRIEAALAASPQRARDGRRSCRSGTRSRGSTRPSRRRPRRATLPKHRPASTTTLWSGSCAEPFTGATVGRPGPFASVPRRSTDSACSAGWPASRTRRSGDATSRHSAQCGAPSTEMAAWRVRTAGSSGQPRVAGLASARRSRRAPSRSAWPRDRSSR